MRRVQTTGDRDCSVNSETKRRMSREESKKYKMEKLRLKFKNVYKQLDSLKN
jgi:hypothetical protein